jgi:hypothetical protein
MKSKLSKLVVLILSIIIIMKQADQLQIQIDCSNLCYAVPQNNRHTLLPENIGLYFVLLQLFKLVTFLPFNSNFLYPVSFRFLIVL